MSMRVTKIFRYPVKSCRGERLGAAVVEPWGLAGDRRWMIVDEDGAVVTARTHHELVLVTPSIDNSSSDNSNMCFTAPDLPELRIPFPQPRPSDPHPRSQPRPRSFDGPRPGSAHPHPRSPHPQPHPSDPQPRSAERIEVTVSRSRVLATVADEAASAWFSKVTGKPVRLVYLDDPTRRATDPAYSEPGDRVSFADGYPLLLVSERSVERVNDWVFEGPFPGEGPLPVTRFRPNVVVGGAPAFAEDGWKRLRIGDIPFRVARGSDRCVFTTIDPQTAAKGREPLVALARHRRWDGKVWFGVNLVPDLPPAASGAPSASGAPAVIRPGDPVEILMSA